MKRTLVFLVAVALLGAGCGQESDQTSVVQQQTTVSAAPTSSSVPPAETTSTTSARSTALGQPSVSILVPDAVAFNLASNGSDHPVVAWSTTDSVMLAEIDLDAGLLGEPLVVSGELKPAAHPIERPAVARGPGGDVWVGFTNRVGAEGSVYLASWDGSTTTAPELLSGDPEPETNLVNMILDAAGAPIVTWLEDSTLSVAMPGPDGVPVEQEDVDDLACDCCDQAPILVGDSLVVSYRNLEHSTEGNIRDVYAVVSPLAEPGFAEPVALADDHWYLSGCPFSGPSAVTLDGILVVAWMDARQSVHPSQGETTIWVDRSSDGAASFGTDHPITDPGIHRSPRLAADDDGALHLVWQTQSPDAGLFYARSEDQGVSFTDPAPLVPSTDEDGVPGNPSLIVHDGLIVVTWADRAGGHVAVWGIG